MLWQLFVIWRQSNASRDRATRAPLNARSEIKP
jgi:hypothetical protein